MLTPEQVRARDQRTTASFFPALMAGDDARIDEEWKRIVGHPDYKPTDLSDAWPVQLGIYLERFVLDWHERKTGLPLTRRGEIVVHPQRPFVSCTLDAWRADDNRVLDVKVSGAFRPIDEIETYYVPQIIAQMRCVGADTGSLLIVHGAAEPRELDLFIDPEYEAVLWARVDQFWWCCETLTPPIPMRTITPPARWRTIDLDAPHDPYNWESEFAGALLQWQLTEIESKKHEIARDAVKKLLPEDVGLVTIAGMAVSRTRANSVVIRHAR